MRISDWSSDVCSSDLEQPGTVEITDGVLYRARLPLPARVVVGTYTAETFLIQDGRVLAAAVREIEVHKSGFERFVAKAADRKSVVEGKSRSVRVDLGGRRPIKKTKHTEQPTKT